MKTKVNRVLTFLLVAAMIVGSIHLVAADDVDESRQPDLTLTLGQKNVNLTAGINYDKSQYDLAITNDGGFDINVVNETGYRVEFSLTPKAAQVEASAGTRTEGGSDPAAESGSGTQQGTPQEKVDTQPSADSSAPESEGGAGKETEEASADDQPTSQSLSAEKEADADVSDGRAVQAVAEDEGRADSSSQQESNADSAGSSEKQDGNTSSSPSDPSSTPGSDASSKHDGADADDVQNGEDAALPPAGAGDSVDGNGRAKTIWRTVYVVEKHILKLDHWPDANELTGDVVEIQFESRMPITVGKTITVRDGKTLIVTGGVKLVDGKNTLFVVEDGGQLTLDGVDITGNTVGPQGAVCVQTGGQLDLGDNGSTSTTVPQISSNSTAAGEARNLVIADSAIVRLNARPYDPIGVSYAEEVSAPVAMMGGGRYTITESDLKKIVADDEELSTVIKLDHVLLRYAKPQFLHWDTTNWFLANGHSDLGIYQARDFEEAGATVTKLTGTNANPAKIEESLAKYDVIMLNAFYRNMQGAFGDGLKHDLDNKEYKLLEDYINNGGRVILQTEDAGGAFVNLNACASHIAQKLGAEYYQPAERRICYDWCKCPRKS